MGARGGVVGAREERGGGGAKKGEGDQRPAFIAEGGADERRRLGIRGACRSDEVARWRDVACGGEGVALARKKEVRETLTGRAHPSVRGRGEARAGLEI